ncbi:MAG: 50S ribosomal protein L11 methyltransferase [Eubacteriales bacterium]
MKWTKITIKTITEAEDMIISTLYDIGLDGAQIEDKVPLTPLEKESMFVDILPDVEEDDGIAYLSFFVEQEENEQENSKELLANIEKELEELRGFMDIGEGSMVISETEDIDWINNWKEYFHQFYIDDLLVIPSWEEVKEEDRDKKILHIDPGTAFGTGMHETTQLCIRQLKKYVNSDTILLDIGCGSGILGIVSLMFGGKRVVGTDLDPCAIEATYANMKSNGIDSKDLEVMIGNLISEQEVKEQVGYGTYDIVVANILAEVLLPLTAVIGKHMKKGAYYITSGIIDDKEKVVTDALQVAGFEIVETTYQGEWVSITARIK